MKAKSCKKGCSLKGNRPHSKGGIPIIVTDIDKTIYAQSGEVIITKPAIDDPTIHTYTGTNKEVVSDVNQSGGGVPIFKKGGEIKKNNNFVKNNKMKTKKYNKVDYELATKLIKRQFTDKGIEKYFKKSNFEKLAIIVHSLREKGIGGKDFNDLVVNDKVQEYLTSLVNLFKQYSKGGEIESLQANLVKAKRQLEAAKEADEKAFAEKKIEKLEAELAKKSAMQNMSDKPKKEAKPKKQNAYNVFVGERMGKYMKEGMKHGEAMQKIASEWKESKGEKPTKAEPKVPKKYTPFRINTSVKKQSVIQGEYDLYQINDDVYHLMHVADKRPKFEFERKNGKWHVQCRVAEKTRQPFSTLQGAVNFVAKELYKGELKELLDEKIHDAKVAKQRIEKRKAQGKPPELTPAEVAEKEKEKIIDKIEEKVENKESVKRDLKAVFNQTRELVEELRQYKKDINKAEVRALITELKKLL